MRDSFFGFVRASFLAYPNKACVEADGGATKQVLVPQARRGLCVRASGSVKPKQPESETERVAFAWLALPREGSGLGNI